MTDSRTKTPREGSEEWERGNKRKQRKKEGQLWGDDKKVEGQLLTHLWQLIAVNLPLWVVIKSFYLIFHTLPPLPSVHFQVALTLSRYPAKPNDARRRLALWQCQRGRRGGGDGGGVKMKVMDRWGGEKGRRGWGRGARRRDGRRRGGSATRQIKTEEEDEGGGELK